MAKLDTKRKIVLILIIIVGVSVLFTNKPQKQIKNLELKEEVSQLAEHTQLNLVSVDQQVTMDQEPKDFDSEVIKEIPQELTKYDSPMEEPDLQPVEPVKEEIKSGFDKFIVYQDKPSKNRFIMSGFMPSALCITMDDAYREACQEGRSCIKAIYDADCSAQETGWAGVYWLFPANNWGDKEGGHDLTGAIKLVFWAKGDRGGEVLNFKMGGVGKDSSFPDSDSAEVGPVVLTKEWKQYTIYLFAKDLSQISGGFAWVAKSKDNQGIVTFYLDDIHYE